MFGRVRAHVTADLNSALLLRRNRIRRALAAIRTMGLEPGRSDWLGTKHMLARIAFAAYRTGVRQPPTARSRDLKNRR